MEPWMETVCAAITDRTNTVFSPERSVGVGGGSISQGFRLTGRDGRRFFVKRNHARRRAMFEAEAAGLVELARCRALRIPEPIALADHGDACFLSSNTSTSADARTARVSAMGSRRCTPSSASISGGRRTISSAAHLSPTRSGRTGQRSTASTVSPSNGVSLRRTARTGA
jgi:hypothetical protein